MTMIEALKNLEDLATQVWSEEDWSPWNPEGLYPWEKEDLFIVLEFYIKKLRFQIEMKRSQEYIFDTCTVVNGPPPVD